MKKVSMRVKKQPLLKAASVGCVVAALAACSPASDAPAAAKPTAQAAAGFEPAPAAVPRLTPAQYRATVADIFGPTIDLGGRFEPDMRIDGLLAIGSSGVGVTSAGMEQYDAMADAIAAQVVDKKNRAMLIPCKPASDKAPDDACAKAFLSNVGRLLFRRPMTNPEVTAYVGAAHAAGTKLNNFYDGLAMSLSAMLSSPQFLFRAPQVTKVANGQGVLDGYSKASQLSFFLWNAGPDVQLLNAAQKGELDTPKGLERQVERMMASHRVEAGVRAFFSDMFHFEDFEALRKDNLIYPMFSRREAMDAQEQTLRTLVDLLITNRADYRDIFTTKKTFLTSSLGAIYRVPVVNDRPNGAIDPWQTFEFAPEDPRGGILSHASFSALHSPANRSSATIRGKAIREVFLCQKVPAPPGNVDFTLVNDTTVYKTARARLTAHSKEPMCAGCHKITDPMGLALENFDGSGAYRTEENGEPIDASGTLDGKKFNNSYELGLALHDNTSATACLVDRLSSYALGRKPAKGETPWVEKLKADFAAGGYVVPDLMKRIATSPEFYRTVPPAATQTASAE
ncbi:MAG: DUF1592 domain-containing protein [Proteobacteria bacterium]|nr:DUF1592 domain-containing protein [Pseudomonadota bacterium]